MVNGIVTKMVEGLLELGIQVKEGQEFLTKGLHTEESEEIVGHLNTLCGMLETKSGSYNGLPANVDLDLLYLGSLVWIGEEGLKGIGEDFYVRFRYAESYAKALGKDPLDTLRYWFTSNTVNKEFIMPSPYEYAKPYFLFYQLFYIKPSIDSQRETLLASMRLFEEQEF